LQLLAIVLASERRGEAQPKPLTRKLLLNPAGEERIEVDLGSGASGLKEIVVIQGALKATVTTSELMTVLGAKTGA
jgi:hypothetical protein